ncbi:MAG: hypothetical protein WC740_02765 [Verrucomicrobiia bacterium]
MKLSWTTGLLLPLIVATVGCNRPAFPERDGRAFLEGRGYPAEVVDAVVLRQPLQHNQIVRFSKCRSPDVRFLVGSNPTLKPEEIELFIDDSNDYARSGTARNTSLTTAQMEKLFDDSSHTVYATLAGNSAVPTSMLMRLHKERNPGLLWFAMNLNCPPEIVEEINKSSDSLAKQWLQIMQQRRKR